jgi:hypothetical protein
MERWLASGFVIGVTGGWVQHGLALGYFCTGVSALVFRVRFRHRSDWRVGAAVACARVFLYGCERAGVRRQVLSLE